MKKRARGVVTSDKMDKTAAVTVRRLVKHRRYGKYVRRKSTLKAHDPHNDARLGDLVEIEETRPLSKTKSWRVLRILRRASELASVADETEAQSVEEQLEKP